MSINGLAVPNPKPLGISSQNNSPMASPMNSPSKKKLTGGGGGVSVRMSANPSSSSTNSLALADLQNDYNTLERSYADLLLRANSLSIDKLQLEKDVHAKAETIAEQASKLQNYEGAIKAMKVEYEKNQELYEKELLFHKELVGDLEIKITKLTSELEKLEHTHQQYQHDQFQQEHEQSLVSESADASTLDEISQKYKELLKDFKVLQSNFEVEQNSKLVLMDQIEYINRERDNEETGNSHNNIINTNTRNNRNKHNTHNHNNNSTIDEEILESVDDFDMDSKEIHIDTFHTLNALHGQSDSDASDDGDDESSDNIYSGKHNGMLSSLADEISSSSPIKDTTRLPSIEHNSNFKFPPSPSDHIGEYKQKQRQSLPARLKSTSPHLDQDEFVLSPLKLTANHNNSNSYFDLESASITKNERRYSSSKPNHSRYNSHDIFPIKVEFEQQQHQQDNVLRSISVPEKIHSDRELQSGTGGNNNRNRNSAFLAETSIESNRNSILTESSSKRSSIILDQSILNNNEINKQELMKLKFELHSLKLHNEKLLSYIGFELQKQKKNIKKLSHKQSLSELTKGSKRIEYSDAKLIEKSREMLINKKRVLRSVSINPIVSRAGGSSNRNSQILGNGLQSGVVGGGLGISYHLFDGEDEYGFLNHHDDESKLSSRMFDSGIREYYDIDDQVDDVVKGPKKYKSQIFRQREYNSSDEDKEDEEEESAEDDSWQDITEGEANVSLPVPKTPAQLSVISQIKSMFVGSSVSKARSSEESIDDTLKYKFLTIAVGILIVGIRFSHQQAAQH